VVVGHSGAGVFDDGFGGSVDIRENFAGGDAQGVDAVVRGPGVPVLVVLDLIGVVVDLAVDLDREAAVAAVEVQYVIAGFMLTADFEAVGSLSEYLP
jgi:hypothetical protein